jgi:hypothetical protein
MVILSEGTTREILYHLKCCENIVGEYLPVWVGFLELVQDIGEIRIMLWVVL